MKVGIMQPYFFPYIGYWQLMSYVDTYVIYDDVNYIKGGWINRNRIIVNKEVKYINLPILGASPNKKIYEVGVNNNEIAKKRILSTIRMNYSKAPYFKQAYDLIEAIILFDEDNLALFLENQIRCMADYLGVDTYICMSSDLEKDNSKKGEERVIDICRRLNASVYVNAVGGKDLYSREHFKNAGLELCFLHPGNISYPQRCPSFIPNLSIIDVLMNNQLCDIRRFLLQFVLT